jgi:hypothetical protein
MARSSVAEPPIYRPFRQVTRLPPTTKKHDGRKDMETALIMAAVAVIKKRGPRAGVRARC